MGDAMMFDEFHNCVRSLSNIEFPEFAAAVHPIVSRDRPDIQKDWENFAADPPRWFIHASDERAKAVWMLVQARQRHAFLAYGKADLHPDECHRCGRNFRDSIHLRVGETP